jgi:hypothetical protein
MTIYDDTITGYKVFNHDFTCRDYDFQGVGTTHTYEDTPVLCQSGFHFCTTLQDCFKYYNITPHMIVCEVQATGYTDAEEGCSKRTCQTLSIIRQMSLNEVAQYITDSVYAYWWARRIGNMDIMIDRITDSEYAYYWAKDIGNTDIMINRITDSVYAYCWAKNIGNQDIMINRITDSEYAYRWARDIGNTDIMIDRITDSEYAYWWAKYIGNTDIMIDRITDSEYAYYWAWYIGNTDIMIARYPDIKRWLAQGYIG